MNNQTNKLLLVSAITLLFRESQLTGAHENSAALVREIIQSIKLPDINVGVDHDREILDGLKATALMMCETPPGHKFELNEILQRLKINTLEEESLYNAFVDGMAEPLNESVLTRTCLNLKRSLNNHFKEDKIKDIINKAAYSIKFNRSQITNVREFVSDVVSQLEPFQVDNVAKDPAVISDVDMNDTEAVEGVFSEIKEVTGGGTVLRTGFQGINRMFAGGFRRGEQWVIGALQHNFKTGFSLTLFKQIALYNKPVLTNPNKKPLLLRISFEDSLLLNFQFLYQSLYENETGLKADLTGKKQSELAAYVQEKLAVNGYHTRFMYVNPSMWTYRDIQNKILALEAEGYEIHLCMLDYLLKVPTTGCDQGPTGHDVRNMYERLRNFMSSRGITMITPHQLSTDAKIQFREGRGDFVKNLVGGGYYAGCKQIDQVVDGEVFIHIECVNNTFWLTIQRGKHRIIEQTPMEDRYCVLPFYEIGNIRDDLMGPDSTRRKIGGGALGSDDELVPFWEEDDLGTTAGVKRKRMA